MRATAEELQKQRHIQEQLRKLSTCSTEPIARFLCDRFRVSDPAQIDPYNGRVHAHSIVRPVMLTIESMATNSFPVTVPFVSKMLDSPQPRIPLPSPADKKTLLLADLDRVCVYNIICRHVAQKELSGPVAVRLNFYHRGVNQVEKAEELDQVYEAAGGVKGAFLGVTPKNTTLEGHDPECVPMAENSYCNAFFVKTMALVNERNVTNDVIQIPFDVCKASGLPVSLAPPLPPREMFSAASGGGGGGAGGLFSSTPTAAGGGGGGGDDALIRKYQEQVHAAAQEQGKELIQSFAAIPYNHVLSWALRSEEFAAQKGINIWYFRVSNRPDVNNILYYLIPEPDYKRLLFSFKNAMLGKIDMRPLQSMAMEFVPLVQGEQVTGSIKLKSFVHYMTIPLSSAGVPISQATIDNLAVTLAPNVPSPENWIPNA